MLSQYVNKSINSFPVGTSFTHICFDLQPLVGRYDGYFDCADGYNDINDGYIRVNGSSLNLVPVSSLSPSQLIYDGYYVAVNVELDSVFTTAPFAGVTYQISPKPFWQDWLINLSSNARLVPAAFTYLESSQSYSCVNTVDTVCDEQFSAAPVVDIGRNDIFIPNNLLIGQGQILNVDGSHFKQDFEVATIELRLPEVPLNELSLNVYEKFVVDVGSGKTAAGYNALRYSDCSTVQLEDLSLNKVKFDVAIQAFYKKS